MLSGVTTHTEKAHATRQVVKDHDPHRRHSNAQWLNTPSELLAIILVIGHVDIPTTISTVVDTGIRQQFWPHQAGSARHRVVHPPANGWTGIRRRVLEPLLKGLKEGGLGKGLRPFFSERKALPFQTHQGSTPCNS